MFFKKAVSKAGGREACEREVTGSHPRVSDSVDLRMCLKNGISNEFSTDADAAGLEAQLYEQVSWDPGSQT